MHPNDRGVDHLHRNVMGASQRIHDLAPHARPPPANEAIIAGGVRAEGLGQAPPRRARTQHPKDAFENAPIVHPGDATRLVRQHLLDAIRKSGESHRCSQHSRLPGGARGARYRKCRTRHTLGGRRMTVGESLVRAWVNALGPTLNVCFLSAVLGSSAFRLSTTAVSMSLTGSCFSSVSAPGPFHHGIRRRGGTIFRSALPSDGRQIQADIRTHLIHRPARDIIPPLRWSSSFLLSHLISRGFHAAATSLRPPELGAVNPDAVHDHGQPAANATISFFISRCLAIFIAQALSQDHFVDRTNMIWAASYSMTRIISSPQRDMQPVQSLSPD